MPSLYQSVKQSIVEYSNQQKQNQRIEDKLVFKWKLIALGLSIFFIVLVGLFSQLLSAINKLPQEMSDSSFALPLLQQVSPLTVKNAGMASSLVTGITNAFGVQGTSYEWNRVSKIYEYTGTLNLPQLLSKIQGKGNLVYVFSSESAGSSAFGMFLKEAYQPSASIQDPGNSRMSTFFNLDKSIMKNFQQSGCSLYKNSPGKLTLFETISFNDGQKQLDVGFVDQAKTSCYSSDQIKACQLLGKLVGTNITDMTHLFLPLTRLQIFQLSFVDQ